MKHILLVFLAVSAVACGKADVSGTFVGQQTGTQNGQPINQTITMVLTQSDSDVLGTWSSSSGTAGPITATLSGSELKDILIHLNGCTGSGTGVGKIDGSRLTGTGVGTFSCAGSSLMLNSSFDLTRQ